MFVNLKHHIPVIYQKVVLSEVNMETLDKDSSTYCASQYENNNINYYKMKEEDNTSFQQETIRQAITPAQGKDT